MVGFTTCHSFYNSYSGETEYYFMEVCDMFTAASIALGVFFILTGAGAIINAIKGNK